MKPHRGRPRVASLALLPCTTLLALSLSAFGQNPAQPQPVPPDQQQSTPAQQDTPAPADSQQSAPAQAPPPSPQPAAPGAQQMPAPATAPPAPPPAASAPTPAVTAPQNSGSVSTADLKSVGIGEDDLKQILVGKIFYLRGGYLDDSLSFNEHGKLAGHSPVGSYTLNMVVIDKVHLSKHKVELEGQRYALHFSNQLAFEDPRTAYDKVRITPKKKVLRITIDRESVVKPKKEKEKEKDKKPQVKLATAPADSAPAAAGPAAATPVTVPSAAAPTASAPTASAPAVAAPAAPGPAPAAAEASTQTPSPTGQAAPATDEPDTEQTKAEIAAAKPEERPADPDSVTSTTSPAHATMVLRQALDTMFAPGLDDRMMAAMPDFWKLYYKAVAEKTDYRPADPAVLRQNTVDKKARLITTFEPESNQFAQDNGVAGMALYHAVIGADGKPEEIAVARPIGFGLDENAVKAIRAAKFEPAEKDGKPVPVMLDLVVQFRIYSKRTNVKDTAPDEAAKPPEPVLPGPYSVQHPAAPTQSSQQ